MTTMIFVPDIALAPGDQAKTISNGVATVINRAGGDTVTVIKQEGGAVIATTRNLADTSTRTVTRAGQDAVATYVKAWEDTAKQGGKSFQDAVDAARATGQFEKSTIQGFFQTYDTAGKRLRDGKVIDAMWGIAVEPMQQSEENFFTATQQSTLINEAAAAAASFYGGPAGAAAYASYQAYKQTGDARLAIRVGILAAATSEAGHYVSQMPTGTTSELFQKAAMSGAVGGMAVAAAGGDQNAVKNAFFKSGGAVLIQGGEERAKAYSPAAKDAVETVQCVSARDVDCLSNTTWARDSDGKALYDKAKQTFDPNQYVGTWSELAKGTPDQVKADLTAKVSELPGSKMIPILHSQWVVTWTLGQSSTLRHGTPAVVLTYVAQNPPFRSVVAYSENRNPDHSAPLQANRSNSSYSCVIGNEYRSLVVVSNARSCNARYSGNGTHETIWESTIDGQICEEKAEEFREHLRGLGMHCVKS